MAIKLTKLKSHSKKNLKEDLPSQVNYQEVTTFMFDHFYFKTNFSNLNLC